MEFDELKEEYNKLSKKYKLPSFDSLNGDFEIGKIERNDGTLVRAVRKLMMEKVVNSLGFLEMLLNPMNVPRAYMNFVRTMGTEDKQRIEKLYSQLSLLSLEALEGEIEYSEKHEGEMITKIFKKWNELKKDFSELIANIKKPNNRLIKKEKTYFE